MKVIVIGGGAAGMMAAAKASEDGAKVLLLEKNEKLGKKLFITGKGRCNLTNAAEMEAFFANICTNSKFLYSAFQSFDNQALMRFVEKAGCPLKTERGGRVFPVSDHSSDVIAAFTRELKKRGVEVRLRTEVKGLIIGEIEKESDERANAGYYEIKEHNDREQDRNREVQLGKKTKGKQGYEKRCIGVTLQNGERLTCDKVIVCTGGISYPSTGSTGDGYRFAKDTGHRIVTPRPALVPLETRESWCRSLMGLSLKNVKAEMSCGKKVLFEDFGEMLFTHFGISGPLVLSASSFLPESFSNSLQEEAFFTIDLKPALSEEQLDARLIKDFEENRNKAFKNALSGLFPSKLIPVMVELSGIEADKKVNEITKKQRRAFLHQIKNLRMTVIGTRPFAEAIITQGGVSVKEINPSTMESKKVQGLFFAGEVLDVDALTGGFNLQIAWSTGYLAGS